MTKRNKLILQAIGHGIGLAIWLIITGWIQRRFGLPTIAGVLLWSLYWVALSVAYGPALHSVLPFRRKPDAELDLRKLGKSDEGTPNK